nr:RepA [Tomato associated geminivirus 2]
MPRQPSSFKIQGKSFFLTYPKCPLIPIFIIDYFYQLLRDHTVTYVRACTENHQDGEPHIHCLVQTEKRFQTKNQRFFDISDPNGSGIYHPNIQVPRRDADVADYISKGGTFEERGILRASRRSPKKNRDSIWTTILNESTSKSDFLTRVFAEQPFTYANNYRNLEYMADKHWPTEPESYTPTWTTFVGIPQSLQNWADQNIFCVSFDNYTLINPHADFSDLVWASETTKTEIREAWENQTDEPTIIDCRNQNGDQTDPPPQL